ncbi:hypothetical protein AMS59_11125 [Lysinibacillus sp. FJAT-14745]|uniref:hypothetical protein n=1 Tax=Lysinibacillus sp. FJAT-14745 TaxID=1704289 RepID=UPI0006ABB387|nr:hypothetical protein [Lysinibacillus sp. FJAT-14745]KOP78414.1 hypothetical protein AMS59_11125 [Lysinibacillus sp. FJAT-14745]
MINYGVSLDLINNYFDIIVYGDTDLFFKQDIILTNGIYLVSNKFIKAWQEVVGVKNDVQWIDFNLLDSKRIPINHDFKIINFTNTINCINWEESQFNVHDDLEKDYNFYMSVFDKTRLEGIKSGCVDCERSIFISDVIKNSLEQYKLNSLFFKEID